MIRSTLLAGVALAVVGAAALPADAQNLFRYTRAADALTFDPHAQNEGPTNQLNNQVYEALVERDNDLALIPALAESWQVTDDPSVWSFTLREGVTFHDGSAFTADDVVFSLNRARGETSDFEGYLSSVAEVRKVDDLTVEIVTDGPNPLLPNNLTNVFMMDQGWAESNDVAQAQDFAAGEETFAVRNANGTGPFRLVSREPDNLTVMERFEEYWGNDMFPTEIDRIEFTPIKSAPTRVAALLSGEVDYVLDPPVQDLERLEGADGISVSTAPENRVIFLGMDVGSDDIPWDNVEGRNPFADPKVRQAIYQAIDIEGIQRVVMRGNSIPAGVIAPPFIDGYTPALDERLPYDPDGARALLAEAGYGDGFQVTLHCPNDRYVNDEGICQAVVGMLGRVGITVDLVARPRSIHFAELQNKQTGFYMLGWGVPTFDSEYVFNFLYNTPDGSRGTWNYTGYSNPEVDRLVAAMLTETDLEARDAMVADVWAIVDDAGPYIPLHHQVINWASADRVDVPIRGDNTPFFKYVTFAD